MYFQGFMCQLDYDVYEELSWRGPKEDVPQCMLMYPEIRQEDVNVWLYFELQN